MSFVANIIYVILRYPCKNSVMEKNSDKNLNRIRYSKLNITIALITSIAMGFLNFIERTVFNRFFIEDYLGLFSFYNSVIGILGTVELGITSSIAFALYAPLEYRNKGQIRAIMSFFKKVYIAIGTIIFCSGLIVMQFFPLLLKTEVPMQWAKIYFLFFLFRTASNYLFGYKSILFTANQEEYKTTLVSNICWCFLYSLDMVITITTQNFLLYSISISVVNLIRLIIINILAIKDFKWIKGAIKEKINPAVKTHIIKNTKGLIVTRFGNMIISVTDTLLISIMVGTATLGLYSNYTMITSGLTTFVNILPKSITASIGNAGVTETRRSMSKSFSIMNLASFFIYGSTTILLVNILNPIVSTFFGSNRTFNMLSVVLICTSFYLTCAREIFFTYKSSLGLYWEDRKRPLIAGLVNLITSVIFGKYMGLNGIILGTIFTNLFVNLLFEPTVIIHKGFRSSAFWFYITIIGRLLLVSGISILTLFINSFIHINGILEIIIKFITTLIVLLLTFLLIYRNNQDARTILSTVKIAFMDKRKLKKLEKEKNKEESSTSSDYQ